ncbi:hypothetical protein K0M31_011997 [Melipona bicolor]|uniref:Uncharacterized protein n=1 Tax=Melipona bicolor TaxID=60889 RepID=A0AA40GAN5_9HYME|nr:hypothetical protein K0M31_011997 [Melipona bicolor]
MLWDLLATPPAAVSVGGCMGKSNGNQYFRGIVTDQDQVDGSKNSSETPEPKPPGAKTMLMPLHALRTTKVQRRSSSQIFGTKDSQFEFANSRTAIFHGTLQRECNVKRDVSLVR